MSTGLGPRDVVRVSAVQDADIDLIDPWVTD